MSTGPVLTGGLVRLRAPRADDVPRMTELLQDPRVTRFLEHWSDPPYRMEKSLQWVNWIRASETAVAWAIESLEDGAYIGNTGLDNIDRQDRRCSWGIWIAPPGRWGRGYGTEACKLSVGHAFKGLGLQKVSLLVYQGNDGARRAYSKAGFAREATLRRHHWDGTRFIDVEQMAVFDDHPLYALPSPPSIITTRV